MELECKVCNKVYSTKVTYKTHLKSTKHLIKIHPELRQEERDKKQMNKEYYDMNKEKLITHLMEPIYCISCNVNILRCNFSTHTKSNKHRLNKKIFTADEKIIKETQDDLKAKEESFKIVRKKNINGARIAG